MNPIVFGACEMCYIFVVIIGSQRYFPMKIVHGLTPVRPSCAKLSEKRWLQEKLTKKPLHRGDFTEDISTKPRTSRKLSDATEVRTSSSIDQQGHGQSPSICDLPDDILLLILRYLSPADETFYSFPRVCRRFRNVSCQLSHYGHRSTIKIGPEDTISFKLFTTLMKEFANHIQTVDFSGCDDVTDQVIHTVAKTCRHLKQLYLTGCGQLTNVGLKVVARYLHELESLDVSLCPWITASGIFLVVTSVGRSLKKLHMNNCLGMRSCGLIAFSLGKYCPKLTHLTLAWTPEFGLQPPAVQLNLIK
ncbi:putative F-box/LRR-repeat protein 7-like [Apostichopus japonicus]|uniref:Putative F-box/LRR-repeat protein 7-like n=1 Tax=Stichopus japonicus TaxID=307972 RepID=A0A2G8LNS0_STIJA|nr:putative F-box/LRR-repeat protein 7-like [Apostichopus japonicus]